MIVTVSPLATNQVPVADAGTDQSINIPTTITTLNGSGSDADGTIASYAWVKVSGPTVTMGAANQASFSLSDLVDGTYVFRLTVQDDDGATDTDDIILTVLPAAVNNAPVVSAGADVNLLDPESTSALDGNASDTDGSVASIEWTQVAGAASTISNPNALFAQVNGLVIGAYRFRLTVTDDDGATAFDEVEIVINPANTNQAPAANAGTDKSVKLPVNSITLNGIGTDADGTIASFSWLKLSGPSATLNGATTADLAITSMAEGTYQFQLTVTDDDGASTADMVTVVVLPAALNEAPLASAGADQSLELPDNIITLTGTAIDDDGPPSITWQQISGPVITMGPTNTLSLSLTNLVEGTFVFRMTATDALTASDFDDVTLTVFPEPVTPGDPVVDAGEDIQIQLPTNTVEILAAASADEGLIVAYAWTQLGGTPVIFERADSVVAVINNMIPGTYSFSVTVTDFGGRTATDQINVTVLEETPVVRPRSLFSPDNKGDAATESWVIENAELLSECELTVYNRQGQKVFGSKGYPIPWDGTFNNSPVPDGAYFYIITCDGKKTQSGSVTIARLK
jgi:gliding motility-associated-like protein